MCTEKAISICTNMFVSHTHCVSKCASAAHGSLFFSLLSGPGSKTSLRDILLFGAFWLSVAAFWPPGGLPAGPAWCSFALVGEPGLVLGGPLVSQLAGFFYSFGPRKQNVPGGRFAFGAVDLPVVNLWAPGGQKGLKTIVKYSISAVPKGP